MQQSNFQNAPSNWMWHFCRTSMVRCQEEFQVVGQTCQLSYWWHQWMTRTFKLISFITAFLVQSSHGRLYTISSNLNIPIQRQYPNKIDGNSLNYTRTERRNSVLLRLYYWYIETLNQANFRILHWQLESTRRQVYFFQWWSCVIRNSRPLQGMVDGDAEHILGGFPVGPRKKLWPRPNWAIFKQEGSGSMFHRFDLY